MTTTDTSTGDAQSDRSAVREQLRLLNIAEGFLQSSVLFALLRLDAFEHIGEDSKSASDLADELGVRSEGLSRVLNAAVALRLLESTGDGTYRLPATSRSV